MEYNMDYLRRFYDDYKNSVKYDSDVVCIFTENGYKEFKKHFYDFLETILFTLYFDNEDFAMSDYRSYLNPQSVSDDGYVLWKNNFVRWDENSWGHPEVTAFMKALDELDYYEYKFINTNRKTGETTGLGGLEYNPFAATKIQKNEEETMSLGM